ncbi:MAG: tetratricopeptide repeat protein, partial [Steroidobacteraceae bacterium]
MVLTPPPSHAVLLFTILLGACATGTTGVPSSPASTRVGSDLSSRQATDGAAGPVVVDQTILKGDTALSNGDFDRALFYYVEALNADPNQALTLIKVGTIHWQRGDLQRSLEAFRRALVIEPANPLALEGAGLALLDLGERAEARASLERAVALDATRWRALQGLGVIADFMGDHARGTAYFRQAIEIRKDVPSLFNNLGYSLLLAGDYTSAERAFFDALRVDPSFERASRNLGLLYVRLGLYDQAVTSLERSESKAAALNDVGYLLMLEGKHDLAEGYFRQALEESPVFFERADENLVRNRQLRASAGNAPSKDKIGRPAGNVAERAAIPGVGTGAMSARATDAPPQPAPLIPPPPAAESPAALAESAIVQEAPAVESVVAEAAEAPA